MPKRAAIYARVSSDEQRSNYSIPTQVQECLAFAERQEYSVVGDRFVDPETGLDTVKSPDRVMAYVDDFTSREMSRPGLDAALTFLEVVGFDVLIVHSLDRLARDPYIRQTLELELQERGAAVEYVLGNYEASPEGEVRKDLDATFAKWENLKRVERSKRGKRGKARRGLFVGGKPPYGYRLDDDAPAGLAVDEGQAETVRLIFQLYAREGESIRGITEILGEQGRETYQGKTTWAKSSVQRILSNETYAGILHYNKTQRTTQGQEERPEEEWIEIPVTPIVEPSLFEEARHRLKRNKAVRRRQPKRFYMLSGMVFCPECGRPFSAETRLAGRNRRKHDAKNYRHRAAEGHCRNQMISARKIEPVVWERIVEIMLDPERLKTEYEASLEQQRATQTRHRRRLETLQRAREKIARKQDNLMQAYLDPDIQLTKPEYLRQRERLDGEADELEEQIGAIQEQLAAFELPPEYETIEVFADKISGRLQEEGGLNSREKRKILQLLHVKVYVAEDDQVWLEGWFDAGREGLSYKSSSWPGRQAPGRRF